MIEELSITAKYPFFDYGKQELKNMDMSIEKLDNDTVYDELIKEASNDIIDSFQHNQIKSKFFVDRLYTVAKFYLILFILKSANSTLFYKYWNKAYLDRKSVV